MNLQLLESAYAPFEMFSKL